MILGGLGANVVKVESMPDGDTSRELDPQLKGESYFFSVGNRNKCSVAPT